MKERGIKCKVPTINVPSVIVSHAQSSHSYMFLLFATVLTDEPRINACFDSPTHGLFLTCTKGVFLFISDGHITCKNNRMYNRLFT
jgi:hypothetical protein